MEILGTKFAITLGAWRINFCLNIEDVDVPSGHVAPQRERTVTAAALPRSRYVGRRMTMN